MKKYKNKLIIYLKKRNEKQFNRQVELNSELKELKKKISSMLK